MVQVTPPSEEIATGQPRTIKNIAMGNAPVDSEALTEDGISASSFPMDSAFAPTASARAPEDGGVFHSPPDANPELATAGPPPAGIPSELVTDENALTPLNFQSDRTRRTRQIVLVAMLSVSLLIVAGLLFRQFVRSQAETDAKTPTRPAAQASETNEQALSSLENQPPEVEPSEASNLPANKETFNVVEAKAKDVEESPALANPADTMNRDAGGVQPEPPLIPTDDDAQKQQDAAAFVRDVIPQPLLRSTNAQAPDPTPKPAMEDLPESLKQFMPFLLQEDPQPEPTLAPLQTIDDIEIDGAEEEASELGIKAPRKINPRSDLAMRIAMRSEAATLPHLTLTFSQITNIPIQIDWVSFDLAGVPVESPFRVSGKTRPIGTWIDESAMKLGAEVQTLQTMLLITLTEEAFASKRDVLLDLSELADPPSAKTVIEQFMNPPESSMIDHEVLPVIDKIEGDQDDVLSNRRVTLKKTPAMTERQRDQLRILATEMLRRMRGAPGKLSDQIIHRWGQVRPGDSTEWKPLTGGKNSLTFDYPIAAAGVFQRLAKANQSWCFVNWNDANRRGLRPARLVLPTKTSSAQEIFTDILKPHLLQIRLVDETHWWIGSGSNYDRLPVLIQSEKLGEHRATFQTQINQIISDADLQSFRSVYDPVSDQMLMMVPRYIARQLPGIKQTSKGSE